MFVKNIEQTIDQGTRTLSAEVHYEREDAKDRLFISVPDTGVANPCPADSFFTNLVLQAMALGERLHMESAVSSDVYAAAMENTVPLMREWFPRLGGPLIEAEIADPARHGEEATALLFSGGIDSWHGLISENTDIDELIHIRGFEIPMHNQALWSVAHAAVNAVANDFGKTVIPVSTNMVEAMITYVGENPRLNWRTFGIDVWYGHLLCAIGMALRPRLDTLFIPSSVVGSVARVATGTQIEPRLSNESQQFRIVGSETTRIAKIDMLGTRYPQFVKQLRVCVDKDFVVTNAAQNCGRCVKCLRTQVELRVCKIEGREAPFATPLDLNICKHIRPSAASRIVWEELAAEAQARGDADAHAMIRIMLDQSAWQRKLRRFTRKFSR